MSSNFENLMELESLLAEIEGDLEIANLLGSKSKIKVESIEAIRANIRKDIERIKAA